VTLTGINNADLGVINKIYTKEIGNDVVTIFEQVNVGESEVSTIVVRGATKTVMNDVERAVDDGPCTHCIIWINDNLDDSCKASLGCRVSMNWAVTGIETLTIGIRLWTATETESIQRRCTWSKCIGL